MKRFLLALFIFVATLGLKAQLAANAGKDTVTCYAQYVNIGGSPSAFGGTPPYTYYWTPSTFADTTSNPLVIVTSSETYSLRVIDAVGDTAFSTVTVLLDRFSGFGIPISVSCFNQHDGSIAAQICCAYPPYIYYPPYTYSWSTGDTSQQIQNLYAGQYSVSVTDSLGCSSSSSIQVTYPFPLNYNSTITNQSHFGACDGRITVVINGGTSPYYCQWSNGATTPSITNLCPGSYSINITDANGCTTWGSFNVNNGLCTNNNMTVSINSQGISCSHETDTIKAIVSGGNPPYVYHWSNSHGLTDTILIAESGIYTLQVYDSVSCLVMVTDTILDTRLHVSLLSYRSESCNNNNDGFAKLSVVGGAPPYSFTWSNGAPNADSIVNIPSGAYNVTVTDNSVCNSFFSVNVPRGSVDWSYYVYVTPTNTNCSNNGSAMALVNGGSPPFTYLWSNLDTAQLTENLTPDNYSVTVTGDDGCYRIGSTTIIESCNNIINGYVYFDADNNCIKDTNEMVVSIGYVNVSDSLGNVYYGSLQVDGFYQIILPTAGAYTASMGDCGQQIINFLDVGDTTSLNFGFSASSCYNLSLHPGWHNSNPGFVKDYWILYCQQIQPLYSGPAAIVFKYDSVLVFDSCNNNGIHNGINHTISWAVSNTPYPTWDWDIAPRAYFTVPANTPVGYQLTQEFWIAPTANDCDTSDNHLLFISPVNSSKDPNTKEVFPEGNILERDSILTYTIHFQNTGNDTTWFITITDTLSPYLDPSSVTNIASSHEYASFDISGTGTLTWLFNPIFLVDSATNETASKGFVSFRVKTKNGLPINTEIKNHASIYFDYNEPIVTNTVTNTITSPSSIFSVTNPKSEIRIYPNPTNTTLNIQTENFNPVLVSVFDINGRKISEQKYTSQIDVSLLTSGIYFIELKGKDDIARKKFVKM